MVSECICCREATRLGEDVERVFMQPAERRPREGQLWIRMAVVDTSRRKPTSRPERGNEWGTDWIQKAQ